MANVFKDVGKGPTAFWNSVSTEWMYLAFKPAIARGVIAPWILG